MGGKICERHNYNYSHLCHRSGGGCVWYIILCKVFLHQVVFHVAGHICLGGEHCNLFPRSLALDVT